jgi:hypothetical protein
MMVEFLNSKANQVQIHGWRVQMIISEKFISVIKEA